MSYIRRIAWYWNHYDKEFKCSKCNRNIFYDTYPVNDDKSDAENFYIMCEDCFKKMIETPKIKMRDRYRQTTLIEGL